MLHGLLSGADVEEILRHRHIDDRLFGQTALRLGMMTQDPGAVDPGLPRIG